MLELEQTKKTVGVLRIINCRLKLLVFGSFLFTGMNLTAQQVFTYDYPPTREYFPFFNSEYIKENRIKSLHTEVMYKSPMQKIEHTLEMDSFSFNIEGVVLSHQKTNSLGVTSLTHFKLGDNGLVTSKQEIDYHRDVTFLFTYNDHNDLIAITETDTKTEVEIQLQEFKFVYEYYDQYKKYWLNDEGLSYKYSIIKLDDQQRVIEERGRSIRGTAKHSIYYRFAGEKLIEYSSNIKETSRREKKYQMIYNEDGLLVEMNEYKDGAYIHHHEFLYENGLLIAILEKLIRNQRIKIIKFKYELN